MSLEKIVIWGAGEWALVITEIIHLTKKYEIIGYLDDVNIDRKGTSFGSSMILGGQEQLAVLRKSGIQNIIIGFGDCKARIKSTLIVKEYGFSLTRAIHPNAVISDSVNIGRGTIVLPGAIINSGTKIGESVIINSGAIIGHGGVIEDGAHIAAGVNLAGKIKIGRGTLIGIGTNIIPGIKIGRNSIIGAGSVITKDIPDNVVAYGVPARICNAVENKI